VAVAVPEVGLDPVEGQAGQREADHLRPGAPDFDAGRGRDSDAGAGDQGRHALQRDTAPDEPEAHPGDGDVGEAEGEEAPGPEDQVAEHLAAPFLICDAARSSQHVPTRQVVSGLVVESQESAGASRSPS
jgi:hypothetical protein